MSPAPVRAWLHNHTADVIDVFVYVVVLNLAVEYIPSVISEGFTLSLLTALVLKLVLEVVVRLKRRIVAGIRDADTGRMKVLIGLALWAVVVGSKFLVLTLEDLLFGNSVSLGGFISVTLLIVVLLLSRAWVRWLLTDNPSLG